MSPEMVHTRALLSRAHLGTPPSSPNLSHALILEYLKQLLLKLVRVKSTDSARKPKSHKPASPRDTQAEEVVVETPKLEYKVNNIQIPDSTVLIH